MFEGKSKANIDINPSVKHLNTAQKLVANSILKLDMDDCINSCRHLFMDNKNVAPQIFALIITNYNTRGI